MADTKRNRAVIGPEQMVTSVDDPSVESARVARNPLQQQDRITSLDVLRGFAVLGILIMIIQWVAC
ncbi:MAG: hypothetical protein ACR2NZ_12175 [Rubripirellula sp.]